MKAGDGMSSRSQVFHDIILAIQEGDANGVIKSINLGLEIVMSAEEILDAAIVPGSERVLDKYQGEDFYIPDVINAAHAIEAGLLSLKPYTKKALKKQEKVVIGTVEGDIHDIGKNIVSLYLNYSGFEIIDVGVNVAPEEFIRSVQKHKPHILGLSALLTTTMGEMERVIDALEKEYLRNTVKVLVGGGPVTREFADYIGADAYASSAREAVSVAKSLVGERVK